MLLLFLVLIGAFFLSVEHQYFDYISFSLFKFAIYFSSYYCWKSLTDIVFCYLVHYAVILPRELMGFEEWGSRRSEGFIR